jgi:hypothetical protein
MILACKRVTYSPLMITVPSQSTTYIFTEPRHSIIDILALREEHDSNIETIVAFGNCCWKTRRAYVRHPGHAVA